jgi:hypothetical protein
LNTFKSDSIAKLTEALSKTQSMIRGARKDNTNPHYKSLYADLESVWDACREHLALNSLAILQLVDVSSDRPFLRTILSHVSGEWVSSDIPLMTNKQDMQALGSAITYARRYGLSALVGVCPSDDDGNAAVVAHDYFKDIVSTVKKITKDFQDKHLLMQISEVYGSSEHLQSLPNEEKKVILERLKDGSYLSDIQTDELESFA